MKKNNISKKVFWDLRSEDFKEDLRRNYKRATGGKNVDAIRATANTLLNNVNSDSPTVEREGYVLGIADALMRYSTKNEKGDDALAAAKLYARIGQGNKDSVRKRLKKAVESDASFGDFGQYNAFMNARFRYNNFEDVRSFLKKFPHEKSLESKTLGIISGLSILIGIFFLSSNLTGAAVGALNQGSSSIFGGLMFILGLVGLFVSLK